MSEKRAFFVVGGEGTGTYMMWNALQAAGCHAESWHNGIHDNYRFEEMPSPFTIRRSLPHAGQWPDVTGTINDLCDAGFSVLVIFMFRETYATYLSVSRRKSDVYSYGEWMQDYVRVIEEYDGLPCELYTPQNYRKSCRLFPVSYENFTKSLIERKMIFSNIFGLLFPDDFEVYDANEKYYR